jgi:hypothetical protein
VKPSHGKRCQALTYDLGGPSPPPPGTRFHSVTTSQVGAWHLFVLSILEASQVEGAVQRKGCHMGATGRIDSLLICHGCRMGMGATFRIVAL